MTVSVHNTNPLTFVTETYVSLWGTNCVFTCHFMNFRLQIGSHSDICAFLCKKIQYFHSYCLVLLGYRILWLLSLQHVWWMVCIRERGSDVCTFCSQYQSRNFLYKYFSPLFFQAKLRLSLSYMSLAQNREGIFHWVLFHFANTPALILISIRIKRKILRSA